MKRSKIKEVESEHPNHTPKLLYYILLLLLLQYYCSIVLKNIKEEY